MKRILVTALAAIPPILPVTDVTGNRRPFQRAVASWYYDGGPTASGWHAYYGVANKYLRFGTRVLFRYRGRTVRAVVDDRGPYIYGRTWDLNQNVAGALGMSGVVTVGYRIGG
jgi:rare lipoprotein A (peptidoglycan hydrolase)